MENKSRAYVIILSYMWTEIPYNVKLSQISWFCGYTWKLSPRSLARQKWAICKSFLRENRIFHQFLNVFFLESFPLYGDQWNTPPWKKASLDVLQSLLLIELGTFRQYQASLTLSSGHSQILSHLHSCEIKSGSGLGTRLPGLISMHKLAKPWNKIDTPDSLNKAMPLCYIQCAQFAPNGMHSQHTHAILQCFNPATGVIYSTPYILFVWHNIHLEGGRFERFHPVLSILSYLLKAPMVPTGAPVVNALFRQRACVENIFR